MLNAGWLPGWTQWTLPGIMERCRICFKLRKRMRSLHESLEKVFITYAEIVELISNVKVSKNNKMPTEVCLACCKKLADIYEFRCQIERSDIELQKTCQIKRVIFADIQDMKCKIEVEEYSSKDDKPLQNYLTEKFVQSSKKTLNYNNTFISRLKTETPNSADNKPLSVKKFLESIKEDPDNEYHITYDVDVDYDPESDVDNGEVKDDVDDDYNPIKKYSYKYEKKVKPKKDEAENQMPIKPVYLRDIRVARTKGPLKKKKTRKLTRKEKMCAHCGKMVKYGLKTHMLTHIGERNMKCDKCPKSFYLKTSFMNHLKIHANKDIQCDKCVAVFRTPEALKKHQMVHTGLVQKIPCETCGKSFKTKGHLWRHCQGVHNMGTKQFSCDQCSMTFLTRSKLNHHKRVHTKERPFKCEICSQPYSYKTDFIRHCLKKHGVFLKGRQVHVMNEEVIVRERALMNDLMLKVNGIIKDDKPINPFDGPHAVKAFEQAVKALKAGKIIIDV